MNCEGAYDPVLDNIPSCGLYNISESDTI
jgi:hypothetical protein